jgi:Ca-dependent carbohydrate-binding module xylan-binding
MRPSRGRFAYNPLRHPSPSPAESAPMSRRCLPVAVLLAVVVAVRAAEPIKLDLADFKLVSAAKSAEDLVKYENDKISFYSNGTATARLTVPADGDYVIVIDASCDAALKQNAKLTLKVADKPVKENFELSTEDQKEYKFDAKLTKGETTLSIAFTNDVYKEGEYDRNLHVHGVRVEKK